MLTDRAEYLAWVVDELEEAERAFEDDPSDHEARRTIWRCQDLLDFYGDPRGAEEHAADQRYQQLIDEGF